MRFIRMPLFLKFLMREGEWRRQTTHKEVFLTFDDGPVPDVTDFVLEQLAKFNAKATFFTVGQNAARYPEIMQRILQQNHQVGNHTFNHLNGWNTNTITYQENVQKCAEVLKDYIPVSEIPLFRPPYGKLTIKQKQVLKDKYRLVFWDLLTYDFDATFSPEACLATSLQKTRPGSIVVFHDSVKAQRNLEYVLPRYLEQLQQDGYVFGTL